MTDATEIRGAGREDGAALLALQLALDAETDLMMVCPGERTATAAEVTERLRQVSESSNGAVPHRCDDSSLTVRADNERARRLYERAGFTSEGVRRGSLCVDGALVDEIAMARVV